MIQSVTVTNPNNDSIVLELKRPEKSGLIIQDIEGLGPAKATINSTDLATIDGSLFSSSRINARNIVLTLAMMFSPTIEDARLRTYRYFPIKKQVKLRIKTDNLDAETVGWVESSEPVIFSKNQTTQISILCPDPFFYELNSTVTDFSGVQSNFEFPFSNESLTENLIEFSTIYLDTRAILYYEGDADTGVVITVNAYGPVGLLTIYNVDTHEVMVLNTDRIENLTGQPFGVGDALVISTLKGQRYVRLLRAGIYTNVISIIGKNTDWFQIMTGDNQFTFTASKGERNVLLSLSHRNAYGGI